jgi:type I restriction enzyme M protein
VEDFSVVVDHAAIAAKNYSLSAGQYFEVRIEYEDLTPAQFAAKVAGYQANLAGMFEQSRELEARITEALGGLRHG